jgi:hypothetical protein
MKPESTTIKDRSIRVKSAKIADTFQGEPAEVFVEVIIRHWHRLKAVTMSAIRIVKREGYKEFVVDWRDPSHVYLQQGVKRYSDALLLRCVEDANEQDADNLIEHFRQYEKDDAAEAA